jgi:hypothetical protein
MTELTVTTDDLYPSAQDLPAHEIQLHHLRIAKWTTVQAAEKVVLHHGGKTVILKNCNGPLEESPPPAAAPTSSAHQTTIAEIGEMKATLAQELAALQEPANRYLFMEQCNYLGRLDEASIEILHVYDQAPDGELTLDQAEEVYTAFQTTAAIALALLTFLRHQHPTVGQA